MGTSQENAFVTIVEIRFLKCQIDLVFQLNCILPHKLVLLRMEEASVVDLLVVEQICLCSYASVASSENNILQRLSKTNH